MKTIFLLISITLATICLSQKEVDSLYRQKFVLAKDLMADSLFFKANEVFLDDLIVEDYILPNEVCFQFGKSLFYSGYKNKSKIFFYKYVELVDTSDQYFAPTVGFLKLLGEDISRYLPEEVDPLSTSQGKGSDSTQVISKSQKGGCDGQVFICPVCNGTTVLVRKGSFGNTYQTCPYCNEDGIMDCESYQLYLKGELFTK